MIKNFECVKCGNCCRNLSVSLVELGEDISKICESDEGKKIIENKPCKYLDENNKCIIYDSKPEVCNNFPSTLIHILKADCKGKWSGKRLNKRNI